MKSKIEHFSYGQLSDDFIRRLTGLVQAHTTVLIKAPEQPIGIEDIDQVGSGTFVRCGDEFGILTATHVANRIGRTDLLGLFLLPEGTAHNFLLDPQEYNISRIGTFRESDEDWAEDLAFMAIARERIGTIQAYRSFVNLNKKQNMRRN